MKLKLNIYFLFIFICLRSFAQDNRDFSIEITYSDFPSRPYVHYYVTTNQIALKKYFKLDSLNVKTIDSKSFKVKQLDSLEKFIYSLDLAEHKSRSDRYCIDGYFYSIRIIINNKTYYFEVDCLGDPLLNNIVYLCNLSIPNQKYCDRYKLHLDR